jgi:cell division protease FtsH
MERAKKILQENAEGHNKLAELLLDREVITSEDVESILGPRPWKSREDEIIAANEEQKGENKEQVKEPTIDETPTQAEQTTQEK